MKVKVKSRGDKRDLLIEVRGDAGEQIDYADVDRLQRAGDALIAPETDRRGDAWVLSYTVPGYVCLRSSSERAVGRPQFERTLRSVLAACRACERERLARRRVLFDPAVGRVQPGERQDAVRLRPPRGCLGALRGERAPHLAGAPTWRRPTAPRGSSWSARSTTPGSRACWPASTSRRSSSGAGPWPRPVPRGRWDPWWMTIGPVPSRRRRRAASISCVWRRRWAPMTCPRAGRDAGGARSGADARGARVGSSGRGVSGARSGTSSCGTHGACVGASGYGSREARAARAGAPVREVPRLSAGRFDGAGRWGGLEPVRPRATRRMPPWGASASAGALRESGSSGPSFSSAPGFSASSVLSVVVRRVSTGERWRLACGQYRMGREEDCEIPLTGNSSLSRHHALLTTVSARGLVVRDEGSANGTYVEGSRVATGEDVPVRPGGLVRPLQRALRAGGVSGRSAVGGAAGRCRGLRSARVR